MINLFRSAPKLRLDISKKDCQKILIVLQSRINVTLSLLKGDSLQFKGEFE